MVRGECVTDLILRHELSGYSTSKGSTCEDVLVASLVNVTHKVSTRDAEAGCLAGGVRMCSVPVTAKFEQMDVCQSCCVVYMHRARK